MLANDMAKIGYLYLKDGIWDGEEIVSKDWVEKSTRSVTYLGNDYDYGYLWWSRSFLGGYFAAGYQGQYILVQPDQDVVVVFQSNFVQSEIGEQPFNLIRFYIIPACGELDSPKHSSSDKMGMCYFLPLLPIPILVRRNQGLRAL